MQIRSKRFQSRPLHSSRPQPDTFIACRFCLCRVTAGTDPVGDPGVAQAPASLHLRHGRHGNKKSPITLCSIVAQPQTPSPGMLQVSRNRRLTCDAWSPQYEEASPLQLFETSQSKGMCGSFFLGKQLLKTCRKCIRWSLFQKRTDFAIQPHGTQSGQTANT